MDKLDALKAFTTVAQLGGFSAAARTLGLPVATVSRKVAELEQSLGVRLFDRSTRHVSLTEVALPYFQQCRMILDALQEADDGISNAQRAPNGELVVTAPVGFGVQHLQPVVIEFMREYPEIAVQLLLVDRMVNLIEEHVDVALRISTLPDSSLIPVHLGQITMVVCAAPGYLRRAGVPQHPDDVSNHSCILWNSLGAQRAWLFKVDGQETMFPIQMRLLTTLPNSAVQAAEAGLGLTQVTSYQAEAAVRDGTLVPVLRAFECKPTPVSLVHPSKRHVPAKLRTFLDFAAPRLRERLQRLAALL